MQTCKSALVLRLSGRLLVGNRHRWVICLRAAAAGWVTAGGDMSRVSPARSMQLILIINVLSLVFYWVTCCPTSLTDNNHSGKAFLLFWFWFIFYRVTFGTMPPSIKYVKGWNASSTQRLMACLDQSRWLSFMCLSLFFFFFFALVVLQNPNRPNDGPLQY